WRDTTKVASWESPIYAEWLAAIREVNQKLPPAKRLRVLAGDTAIDWNHIQSQSDWAALGDNNISFADVINHQVLDKKHHVLVVLGSNHVTKSGDRNGNPNTTTLVESKYPGSTYVVLLLSGRAIPSDAEDRLNLPKRTKPTLYDLAAMGDKYKQSSIYKQADALLYLVPREDYAQVTFPPESFDYAYVKEAERRSMIEWGDLRVQKMFVSSIDGNGDPPASGGVTSPRIEALKKKVEAGDLSAIAEFWNEMKVKGAPLIESIPDNKNRSLVTFLYRGNERTTGVAIYAQLSNRRDLSENNFTHLPGTDVWYKTYSIRSDMRLGYSLVPNSANFANDQSSQVADPLNPKMAPKLLNMGQSILELPGAPPEPWIIAQPGVPNGKIEEVLLDSKILNSERRAWIYIPAGYDPNRTAPYPMLICFDGWIYSHNELLPTPIILDNLIAKGKIPPMMAIFVDQAPQPQRNIELGNNDPFLNFVTDELLPLIRKRWRATSDPRRTIVCGSSAGGL